MKVAEISSLGKHINEHVQIRGWLRRKRSSGKIQFLFLRDGSGFVQAIVEKSSVPESVFQVAASLKMESSLIVTGLVKAEERAPGGAVREFYNDRGFVLVDTPIFTGSIGESAGNTFEIDYFDYGKAYLAQTGQLYLEAAAMALGKVYNLGPTFRAEKSKTRRHLIEFWMNEAEVAYYGHDDNIKLQEDLVTYVVKKTLERAGEYLRSVGRDTSRLEKIETPFPRITYDEAIKLLVKKGFDIKWGDDIGGDEETAIANEFEKPVVVERYPRMMKAFYMQPDPERPEVVLCDDMLAPEGYGEIIGASERIHDRDLLVERIQEYGLDVESYDWYLDLRDYGTVPHSGFGMGIERIVAWIAGLEHIREAIPFARTLYRIHP